MNRFAGVREKKEELDRKYQPADDLYLDETLPYTEYPTLVETPTVSPKATDFTDLEWEEFER